MNHRPQCYWKNVDEDENHVRRVDGEDWTSFLLLRLATTDGHPPRPPRAAHCYGKGGDRFSTIDASVKF